MGILKYKDLKQMTEKERIDKLKELKLELIRSKASSKDNKMNTKEIKKAIARILTFNRLNKPEKAGSIDKT